MHGNINIKWCFVLMPIAEISVYKMRENIEFVDYSFDRHLTAVSTISRCLRVIRLVSRNLLLMAKEWLGIRTKLSLFSNKFPNTKQQPFRCTEFHPYFDVDTANV